MRGGRREVGNLSLCSLDGGVQKSPAPSVRHRCGKSTPLHTANACDPQSQTQAPAGLTGLAYCALHSTGAKFRNRALQCDNYASQDKTGRLQASWTESDSGAAEGDDQEQNSEQKLGEHWVSSKFCDFLLHSVWISHCSAS
jgi:hypothetical protein